MSGIERLTDYAAAIVRRGPDRVIINMHGDGIGADRAKRLFNVTPDVIFIRDDGWSLGAPFKFEGLAERMWLEQWIGVMRKNRYATPQDPPTWNDPVPYVRGH